MDNLIQINGRLPYNTQLKERTRDLRKNMTETEKKLWYWFLRWCQKSFLPPPRLRGKEGEFLLRIYKQRPIHNFIVDFYVPKLKLVIEIDWESHFDNQWIEYDKERTAILEWLWLRVIRFTNNEVMNNFEWVCETLNWIFSENIK